MSVHVLPWNCGSGPYHLRRWVGCFALIVLSLVPLRSALSAVQGKAYHKDTATDTTPSSPLHLVESSYHRSEGDENTTLLNQTTFNTLEATQTYLSSGWERSTNLPYKDHVPATVDNFTTLEEPSGSEDKPTNESSARWTTADNGLTNDSSSASTVASGINEDRNVSNAVNNVSAEVFTRHWDATYDPSIYEDDNQTMVTSDPANGIMNITVVIDKAKNMSDEENVTTDANIALNLTVMDTTGHPQTGPVFVNHVKKTTAIMTSESTTDSKERIETTTDLTTADANVTLPHLSLVDWIDSIINNSNGSFIKSKTVTGSMPPRADNNQTTIQQHQNHRKPKRKTDRSLQKFLHNPHKNKTISLDRNSSTTSENKSARYNYDSRNETENSSSYFNGVEKIVLSNNNSVELLASGHHRLIDTTPVADDSDRGYLVNTSHVSATSPKSLTIVGEEKSGGDETPRRNPDGNAENSTVTVEWMSRMGVTENGIEERTPENVSSPLHSGVPVTGSPKLAPDTTISPNDTVPSKRNATFPTDFHISGVLRIIEGLEWNPDLLDSNCVEYRIHSHDMREQLENLFSKTAIADFLRGIAIKGFSRQGSVIVEYSLWLKEYSDNLDRGIMIHLFNSQLHSGKFGKYKADPSYTNFEVPAYPSGREGENSPDDPPVPQWAIAVIVIAAACLIFFILFGAVTIYGRSHSSARACQSIYDKDGLVDDGRDWEKYLAAAYENLAADGIYDIREKDEKSRRYSQNCRTMLDEDWPTDWLSEGKPRRTSSQSVAVEHEK